ncbi:hypothetical protein HMPREF1550_01317 [Actinomyces sp. oral taxon 877 str. F0543]|nr:hypothetical protein HMPREF1550_01317 [Actinomyces sp. oral taxon 877 str. F0543]
MRGGWLCGVGGYEWRPRLGGRWALRRPYNAREAFVYCDVHPPPPRRPGPGPGAGPRPASFPYNDRQTTAPCPDALRARSEESRP